MGRRQFAQHHVAIGHGQRATTAVTRRTRVRAGAFWPYLKPAIAECTDGPATSSYSVDIHHRGTHTHARNFSFKRPLEHTSVMADIRACPTHVKPDQAIKPRLRTRLDHSDNATRRTGQNRIFALEQTGIGKPAI